MSQRPFFRRDGKLLVAAFVYGTLRPGDYNHDRFPGGVVDIFRGVTAKGKLYHAFDLPQRMYPGARFDEEGTIVGDLLVYDVDTEAFRNVCAMELGAGYSMVTVDVALPGNLTTSKALSFQHDNPCGSVIESGDWFAPDAFEPQGLEPDCFELDDDWDDEEDDLADYDYDWNEIQESL